MTLTKCAFDEIMGAYTEHLVNEDLQFLRSYPFLADIPSSKLLSVWHMFVELNYSRNTVIYAEKDVVKHVYLIREGEIEISQLEYIDVGQEMLDTSAAATAFRASKSVRVVEQLNLSVRQKRLREKHKRVPILILGANSYFGQQEILNKSKERTTLAVVRSIAAKIYQIEKSVNVTNILSLLYSSTFFTFFLLFLLVLLALHVFPPSPFFLETHRYLTLLQDSRKFHIGWEETLKFRNTTRRACF